MLKQQGLSLIEILVALAVGILILAAASSVGLTSYIGSRNIMRTALYQDHLDRVITVAVRELRRAGFNAGVEVPGNDATANVNQFRRMYLPDSSCVLFRYDRDVPTTLAAPSPAGAGIVDTDEIVGLRYDADTQQVLLLVSAPDIAVIDCSGNGWEPLNDPSNLHIRAFSVTANTTPATDSPGVQLVQSVTLSMTTTDGVGEQERVINEVVQLRNLPKLCASSSAAGTCDD